jgi:O-acetyl-ADP-ribose deacetylase (regulator of RNase III)
VAIPPISSGIFGYPKHLCAEDILTALEEYASEHKNDMDKSLESVRVVMNDFETFYPFKTEFNKRYPY